MCSNFVGAVFGHKQDKRSFANDPNLPISTKFVGIEIEAENIIGDPLTSRRNLNDSLYFWEIDEDGSLRNNGAEFISRKLRGSDIRAALEELVRVLSENKITPIFSDRTSVHIHSDVRAMDYKHFVNFLSLYMFCEPFLFYVGGWKRKYNSYCVPFWDDFNKQELISILSSDVTSVHNRLSNYINLFNKYDALNLYSISGKGTIEFRHHEGTLNVDRIYNWARIILTLFNISEELDKQKLIEGHKDDKFRNNLLYRIFKNTEDQFPKEVTSLAMHNMLTYSILQKVPKNLYKLKEPAKKKANKNEAKTTEANTPTTNDIFLEVNNTMAEELVLTNTTSQRIITSFLVSTRNEEETS